MSATRHPPIVWSWSYEQEDRKRERQADKALHGRHGPMNYKCSNTMPFDVDRKLLKDLVKEKMGEEVGRIQFLSAGTFHKAYLVTLSSHRSLVARVARRFMPRLKTSSEVATIAYLRERTKVPVPLIYHWDANPYNRLGGEFLFMQKASGISLSKVYQGLSYSELLGLLKNLAKLIIPLFAHRFNAIGSLYLGKSATSSGHLQLQVPSIYSSEAATPKPRLVASSGYPFDLSNDSRFSVPTLSSIEGNSPGSPSEFHIGSIISWPFFGSNRGELAHSSEINRGPWSTTSAYLLACAQREISSVISENEGRSAPHKLHLDPDEVRSSRYHRLRKVDGDASDESDEWGLEESEDDEWEDPGDLRYDYGDYRRMQRSAFLIRVLQEREDKVRNEMKRWVNIMERLRVVVEKEGLEEFAFDCHDLSLENVFVDEQDKTKITCIIDWESTSTRPLWAAAHVPAFIQSSPFVAKLFRKVVADLASDTDTTLPPAYIARHSSSSASPLAALCAEWLHYESRGIRLRMVHRCAEWDGWEEGLVDSILGNEEDEDAWFRDPEEEHDPTQDEDGDCLPEQVGHRLASESILRNGVPPVNLSLPQLAKRQLSLSTTQGMGLPSMGVSVLDSTERAKEKMLDGTGDICGGRGGELGRRLEAWLSDASGEKK